MTVLLVATTNAGKLRELLPYLDGLGWEPVGLEAFPDVSTAPEDEDSLVANARSKALHYAHLTGVSTLADDSGLEVAALGGAPGVRSARFAGPQADDEANRQRLLAELQGVRDRAARFVCALCLVVDGRPLVEVQGTCQGTITTAARGTGGFGYDPLFTPDDPSAEGRTFAELDSTHKQRLSHRGAALRALREALGGRS